MTSIPAYTTIGLIKSGRVFADVRRMFGEVFRVLCLRNRTFSLIDPVFRGICRGNKLRIFRQSRSDRAAFIKSIAAAYRHAADFMAGICRAV